MVAPHNIASLKDKFILKMWVVKLIPKFGGTWRYIFYRDMQEEAPFRPVETVRVKAGQDFDRQIELLESGWVGFDWRMLKASRMFCLEKRPACKAKAGPAGERVIDYHPIDRSLIAAGPGNVPSPNTMGRNAHARISLTRNSDFRNVQTHLFSPLFIESIAAWTETDSDGYVFVCDSFRWHKVVPLGRRTNRAIFIIGSHSNTLWI